MTTSRGMQFSFRHKKKDQAAKRVEKISKFVAVHLTLKYFGLNLSPIRLVVFVCLLLLSIIRIQWT